MFDLTTDPMNPGYLFTTGNRSYHQCHDSFVREGIDGKDILFVSDGNGTYTLSGWITSELHEMGIEN